LEESLCLYTYLCDAINYASNEKAIYYMCFLDCHYDLLTKFLISVRASKILVLITVKVVILGISKGLSVLMTVIVGAGFVTVTGVIVVVEGVIVVVEMEVEAGRVVLRFNVVVDKRVVVCVNVAVVVEMEVMVVGCSNCC
jgi:hypothetical protein